MSNKMEDAPTNEVKIGKVLKGTSINIKELIGKPFIVVNYSKVKSKKDDCDYYYTFNTLIKGNRNGKNVIMAYYTHSGAKEITAFFDRVESGEIKLPLALKLCEEGKTLYFDGYRDYNERAAMDLISEYNIDESLLQALDEEE